MTNRADFKEPVKMSLAKRAANSCSFPGCDAVTEGPSSENDMSISKTGMACHIYAAATGSAARRVNLDMSDEELSDISNGIWMCYTHGKLIDTDESTYTAEQLKIWKQVAEVRARLWQQLGRRIELSPEHFNSIPLPETKLDFESLGQENYLIGEAISRSCLKQIWGNEVSHVIRDALIEIIRNAFGHGGADKVTLEIKHKSIVLSDNGSIYEAKNLLEENHKGGGFHSIDELVTNHNESIYFSSYNDESKNYHVFSVVSASKDIKELTPCHIEIPMEYYWGKGIQFNVAEFCKTIYVIFPEYFALSDALKLPILINEHLPKGKEFIFAGQNLSRRAVELMEEELLRMQISNVKIINYGEKSYNN
jgi:hypothetical protein